MKPKAYFCQVCGERFDYPDIVCAKHQLERDRIQKKWREDPGYQKIQEEARKRIEKYFPKK
ncbi:MULTISPECIES: hypothetical protein [unclassified Thermoactinomyces]|jgi:hypothetical protein|uniref:hypothetical protein n=1 Tax=unclassified Thermoactinomyces TaxID=2634588 RepID=UPI0018DE2B35|nr:MULTISPECIES: hypothetical protein [unclassified Thermoactinomyces]MBH8598612.1 hypothetical protein [Thermoactinomyces sp. CICC 10523]MBH8605133.1 hypothetical protein [Thermoactinomyces sp. CICC 10522]MBH8609319.1 hypothetical protein [Thermoactinomyces sp. CICC 10521]